jgi:polysaccharide export outer membrane protein
MTVLLAIVMTLAAAAPLRGPDLSAFAAQTPAPPGPSERVVQKSDILRIQSSLSSWVRTIEADGTIAFPTLGSVKAEGLTVRQLEDLIELGLRGKALIGPRDRIIVEVESGQSAQSAPSAPLKEAVVFVTGEVRAPGRIEMGTNPKNMFLNIAIARAEGLTPQAGPDVYVVRPRRSSSDAASTPTSIDETTAQRFRYSRKQLSETYKDPPIQDGDTIYVPQAELFFTTGEVRRPGARVWEPHLTVGDAIAMASGMTDKGSLERSYIQRKNDKGTYERIGKLTLETKFLPKDTLVIARSLFGP